MLVSSLPVMVLGAGTAMAHMLRADAEGVHEDQGSRTTGDAAALVRDHGPDLWPDADLEAERGGGPRGSASDVDEARGQDAEEPLHVGDGTSADNELVNRRIDQATAAAAELLAGGRSVSRRTLRAAGVRGSNAELNLLAQQIRRSAA